MKSSYLCCLVLLISTALDAQQLLVFPAVTDEQPGMNGSLWVTTALVVKENPRDEVTIRRKWVCLRGGGLPLGFGPAIEGWARRLPL